MGGEDGEVKDRRVGGRRESRGHIQQKINVAVVFGYLCKAANAAALAFTQCFISQWIIPENAFMHKCLLAVVLG